MPVTKPSTHPLSDLVINALKLGVIVLDRNGMILAWNDWMIRHSGISRESAIGQDIETIFESGLPNSLKTALNNVRTYKLPVLLSNALHRHPLPLFANLALHSPDRIQQSISITPLMDQIGTAYCLIQVADSSTSIKRERLLKDQSDRFAQAATIDSLTGAYNRRFFDERFKAELGRAQRQQTPFSLMLLDIDYFKLYNDTYGHPAGDRVLIGVVQALKSRINRSADVLARYGGEEFAVILPDCGSQGSLALAQKLCQEIANLHIPHSASLISNHVTISIGVASLRPGSKCDAGYLLQLADKSLYTAKAAGRNQVSSIDNGECTNFNSAC